MVTRSLLDWWVDGGATLAVPLRVQHNRWEPCHGVSLIICHKHKSSIHVFITLFPMELGPWMVMNIESRNLEAGICSFFFRNFLVKKLHKVDEACQV